MYIYEYACTYRVIYIYMTYTYNTRIRILNVTSHVNTYTRAPARAAAAQRCLHSLAPLLVSLLGPRCCTLLHAVCSHLKWPRTAHICDSSPRREHAWHLFRWAHDPWVWNERTDEFFLSETRLQNGNAISSTPNKELGFIGRFLANVGFLSQ